MPSRDEVARLASLAAGLQKQTRALPHASEEDARRCVRFACGCVINDEGLPPLFLAFGLPELRDSFEVAARWAEGEDVPPGKLRFSWDWARGRAGTMSTNLSSQSAAHWAIVYAIEAAMHAAAPEDDPERRKRVAAAAEECARYALRAHAGHAAADAIRYQSRLLASIFGTDAG
jgi:hypothetical protein